jgi:hypothetical protein
MGLVSLLGLFVYARTGHDVRHTIIGQVLASCVVLSGLAWMAGSSVARSSSAGIGARDESHKGVGVARHERRMLLFGAAVIVAGVVGSVGISIITQSLNAPEWLSVLATYVGAAVVMVGIVMIVQSILSAARR